MQEAYSEIYEMKAIGKAGDKAADVGDHKYGEKAQAIGGGWIGKQGGIGKDKKAVNDPKADDRRAEKQKNQANKDRADVNKSKYGVSPEERKKRAKKNKEERINREGEAYLKKLQGK
jgi:hypothetical protein